MFSSFNICDTGHCWRYSDLSSWTLHSKWRTQILNNKTRISHTSKFYAENKSEYQDRACLE